MSSEIETTKSSLNGCSQGEPYKILKPLSPKKFELRNSLLTDLFEDKHIKTVYHLFISLFMCLVINTVIHDYVQNGKIVLGFRLIEKGFGNFHLTALTWALFLFLSCLAFRFFKFWAATRLVIYPGTFQVKIWDSCGLIAVSLYYVFSFRLAAVLVSSFDLPPASSSIIVIEQTRMLMKIHAFLRSNVPKVLRDKVNAEDKLILPKFSYFLYFLFAPTLVYSDSYPRTKRIRPRFILRCLVEIVGCVFLFSFTFERFLIPSFQEFGLRPFTWSELGLQILENCISGLILLLATFFLILHSVQNLFAELLKFGDRLFYQDWWTATSHSEYFRKWNVVVADWLYMYIYKDCYEFITPNNKTAAKIVVFIVSAIVHEWILTYILGFFFPVLFFMFFFLGLALAFIHAPKYSIFNILFWYGMGLGNSTLVCIYAIEFFARLNVPLNNTSFRDFFTPRSLTCDCII